MPQTYNVEKDYSNTRLDRWFKLKIKDLPQSLIEKIIRLNKIKVNKKKQKSSYRLQEGDIVEIHNISKFKPKSPNKILKYKPSQKELSNYNKIILENNENFIVINKPAGVAVQSGTRSLKNIIDILKESKYFNDQKPYIVHRLDKETSGVLIIAKNRSYAQLFTSLFRIRKIHKTYLALTFGKIQKVKNTLKDNLIYYEGKKKITQKAVTHYKVLKNSEKYSFVELNPITGRKHQLRRQLYNIGNPIIGDNKYYFSINRKNRDIKKKSLMLHAYKIKFMINNVQYNFKASYSNLFEEFIKKNF